MHPFRYLNLRDLGRLSPKRQNAVLALVGFAILAQMTASVVVVLVVIL